MPDIKGEVTRREVKRFLYEVWTRCEDQVLTQKAHNLLYRLDQTWILYGPPERRHRGRR